MIFTFLKSNIAKILIFFTIVLVVTLLSFMVFKQFEINKRQQSIEESIVAQKQLVDNITRSMSQYTTAKDLEQFIKDNGLNLKAIKDDMSTLHAEIKAVNVVSVTTNPVNLNNIATTSIGPSNPSPINTSPVVTCHDGEAITCPNTDIFGYQKATQNFSLNEDFSGTQVPIGSVGFSAWQKNPWDVHLPAREYDVTSVVGTDENERHYFYNKFTIKVDGKNYDVKINKASTQEVYPEPKFSWWNPRLFLTAGGDLSLNGGVHFSSNFGGTIGISSYGKYKTTPDVSLFQVGVGYQTYSQELVLIINPVNVNIGKVIPLGLANNTYIGPSLQVSKTGHIFVGLNLSLGL